jgi:hypothetical protein
MEEVFIYSNPLKVEGRIIAKNHGKSIVDGIVGIEIEVEGKNLPKADNIPASEWKYDKDGSLRGEENAEYIFQGPCSWEHADKRLDILWDAFKKKGAILDDSNRTSVHVHLNCQQFHLNRLASFAALYFAVEEVLTDWCGDHRVGNLFCLRGQDAPAIISTLADYIRSNGSSMCFFDGLHYSAFNIQAIQKFGSVEIRTLRGVSEVGLVKTWLAVLRRLYDMSAEFKDPRDVLGLFSQGGPLNFFYTVLGKELGDELLKTVDYDEEKLTKSLFNGVRLIQPVCYCRDWDLYVPVVPVIDPFGRDEDAEPSSYSLTTAPSPQLSPTAYYDYPVLQPFQVKTVELVYDDWVKVISPTPFSPPPPVPTNTVAGAVEDGDDDFFEPEFDEYTEDDE